MHGNAVAASACHSELVSSTNFTNVYRYAIGFISHRLHRFKRFFILIIQFAFLLRKNRSMDLHRFLSLRDGFSRCSRGARTLRCSRFCCSLFFFRSFFLTEFTERTEFFLFQNSRFDFVKCARRNSRKRRCCAGVLFGISISHKFHKCLSLCDRFYLPQITQI